jgi:D-tyrosyl-tRNA(Tyr) deacylase
VTVEEREEARIGRGLLVLLGVAAGDGGKEVVWTARKTAEMRIFADEAGKMNFSVSDIGGEILVVSQFTLLADLQKGRRPSFICAAPPAEGERLYLEYVEEVRRRSGCAVRTGVFGAMMQVGLENDGPVTFVLDSPG